MFGIFSKTSHTPNGKMYFNKVIPKCFSRPLETVKVGYSDLKHEIRRKQPTSSVPPWGPNAMHRYCSMYREVGIGMLVSTLLYLAFWTIYFYTYSFLSCIESHPYHICRHIRRNTLYFQYLYPSGPGVNSYQEWIPLIITCILDSAVFIVCIFNSPPNIGGTGRRGAGAGSS